MRNFFLERLAENLVSGPKMLLYRIVFFLCLLVPIVILAIGNYGRTYREETEGVLSQKKAMSYLVATTIHERLNALVNLGISLVSNNLMIEELEKGNWTEAMSRVTGVSEQFPMISRLVLYDTQGIIMADMPPSSPSVIGQSRADREWYQGVKKRWMPYVSAVTQRGAEPRINVVSILIPVKTKGAVINKDSSSPDESRKVLAFLQIQFRLDLFSEWILNVDSGLGRFFYIVDQKGQIVYHPKFSSQDKIVDLSSVPLVQEVLKGKSGARLNYNPFEKELRVAGIEPVPEYGWGLIMTQPAALAFFKRDHDLRGLVIIYGIAFVVIFGLGCFTLHTMTLQKRMGEKVRQLMRAVEQSPATIVITDIAGKIEYANPKFTQLTGYSLAEVLGQTSRILKTGTHSREFYRKLWDTILSGKEWHGEFYNKKKNGESFWESALIAPVLDTQGLITHFIAIKEDITEYKRLTEDAKQAAAIKAAFISMVSHELRTPLGPIKEGASIILDGLVGDVSAEQRELLNIIKSNADRLHRLVDNVLDFQKLESGNMPFDMKKNFIADVIKEVAGAMSLVAQKKQLVITVDCDEDIPSILFDRDKIVQVMTNLLNNAIKFTDQGHITIKAKKEGNTVHIVVEDTGPGMKAEDIPKLFHSFSQLKDVHSRKTGGTGLGLAISKEIIMRHHGSIWAESEFGKGSSFHFALPIEERRTRYA
ncbi:MAG: PAS domain S-box protein [Candidatus Omnitrophica bacterium]|nr:PAS domain S-box protein [Candidatus Omnitrophota bacterium]